MRLHPDQLDAHLKRSSTTPIYFVSGDEPLQKLECIDLIRKHYRDQGFDERIIFNVDKSFNWNSINEVTRNLSLFSSRKIIEIRMPSGKPGKEGSAALSQLVAEPNPDNLVLISR